jgi:hypothetical protein
VAIETFGQIVLWSIAAEVAIWAFAAMLVVFAIVEGKQKRHADAEDIGVAAVVLLEFGSPLPVIAVVGSAAVFAIPRLVEILERVPQ